MCACFYSTHNKREPTLFSASIAKTNKKALSLSIHHLALISEGRSSREAFAPCEWFWFFGSKAFPPYQAMFVLFLHECHTSTPHTHTKSVIGERERERERKKESVGEQNKQKHEKEDKISYVLFTVYLQGCICWYVRYPCLRGLGGWDAFLVLFLLFIHPMPRCFRSFC